MRSVSQYKLVDDQDLASFQTGLRRSGSLRRKETYAAYRLPIYPVRRGGEVSVYGQLRPAPDGAAAFVDIQHAASAGGPLTTVQAITVRSGPPVPLPRPVPPRCLPPRLRNLTSRAAHPAGRGASASRPSRTAVISAGRSTWRP